MDDFVPQIYLAVSNPDDNHCFSSHSSFVQGFLEKGKIKTNRRFFTLQGETLHYSDAPGKPVKKALNLKGATVNFDDTKRLIHFFGKDVLPTSPEKEYYLSAPTRSDYLRWKSAIAKAVSHASGSNLISYSSSFSIMLDGYRSCLRGAVERCMLEGNDVDANLSVFDAAKLSANVVLAHDTAPSEDALKQMWDMSVASEQDKITFQEHRSIFTQVLHELRKNIDLYLVDFLAVVLRARNLNNAEKEAQEILGKNDKLKETVQQFSESIGQHADQTAEQMWQYMDSDADGFAKYEDFLRVYRSFKLIPPSLFIDIVQDEIGTQVDEYATRKTEGSRKGRTGLLNLGNTCYFNAAIQCILHTSKLRNYLLLGQQPGSPLALSPKNEDRPLCQALKNLAEKMWMGSERNLNPITVKTVMNKKTGHFFAPRQQHDAHEMLSAILDSLHEELNTGEKQPYKELPDKPTKPDAEIANEWWVPHAAANDSIVFDLFHGQTRSCVTCGVCGEQSLCFDPLATLMLPLGRASCSKEAPEKVPVPPNRLPSDPAPGLTVPANPLGRQQSTSVWDEASSSSAPPSRQETLIPDIQTSVPGARPPPPPVGKRIPSPPPPPPPQWTLDECMSLLFQEELTGANAVRCACCKQDTPSKKITSIWKPPMNLTVCLKRFSHDMYGRLFSKNDTPVQIDLKWDITRWVHPQSTALFEPHHLRSLSGANQYDFLSPSLISPAHSRSTSMTSSACLSPNSDGPKGTYELYAAIHHIGQLNYGHYVATCKLRDGNWYLFNDGVVTPLKDDWVESYRSSVYVLMYRML